MNEHEDFLSSYWNDLQFAASEVGDTDGSSDVSAQPSELPWMKTDRLRRTMKFLTRMKRSNLMDQNLYSSLLAPFQELYAQTVDSMNKQEGLNNNADAIIEIVTGQATDSSQWHCSLNCIEGINQSSVVKEIIQMAKNEDKTEGKTLKYNVSDNTRNSKYQTVKETKNAQSEDSKSATELNGNAARQLQGQPSKRCSMPGSMPGSSLMPDSSSMPGSSSLQGSSSIPGRSLMPGSSSTPGSSSMPGSSSVPGSSSMPGSRSVPGNRSMPGSSLMPGSSSMPDSSSMTDRSSMPAISRPDSSGPRPRPAFVKRKFPFAIQTPNKQAKVNDGKTQQDQQPILQIQPESRPRMQSDEQVKSKMQRDFYQVTSKLDPDSDLKSQVGQKSKSGMQANPQLMSGKPFGLHSELNEPNRSNGFFQTQSSNPVRGFTSVSNGKPHRNENEVIDGGSEAQPSNPFMTARDQFIIDQRKKNRLGESNVSIRSSDYGQTKKSLGTRRGTSSKFVPPVMNREENGCNAVNRSAYNSTTSHNKSNQCEDERLKNIEPRMVEMIENEIMDHGPPTTWDDIAGLEFAKKTIQEIVIWPMLRPDIFTGLRGPPKGLLLFGPPGTGKTLIGKCIASQSHATFFSISASSLTSKWIGEGEKMVRALFAVARCHESAVVFIDEIDSLLSQRTDGEHEASRRIKTEFLIQLDGATTKSEERLLVVGATNRPQELDEAARRRLVKRLYIPLPDDDARRQIVYNLVKEQNCSLSEENYSEIVKNSQGYSGADMANLCREAALGPIRSMSLKDIRHIKPDEVRPILYKDFEMALKSIRPSVSQKDLETYNTWNRQYGSGEL